MNTDFNHLAERLKTSIDDNTPFPDDLHGYFSINSSYEAQFHLLSLQQSCGEKLVGWKVGLTAKAMQQQQGVHEPCLGHLLRSGHKSSNTNIDYSSLMEPGFENELCLLIKAPLFGADITYDQAKSAIGAVAPALEIIEKRSNLTADFPLALAGNAQQRFFVTNTFLPMTPDISLKDATVDVYLNGALQEHATGEAVLNDPIHSIQWLVKKLHEFGRGIDAGQMIMSGSFTKQYSLKKGDKIKSNFHPFGPVQAEIA